jgi:hypothetical protein
MQTTDEATNMLALFGEGPQRADGLAHADATAAASATPSAPGSSPSATAAAGPPPPVLTEAQALAELPAIPIYFASSYALVKPYVRGFESNLLDAPSLKHVQIEMGWRDPRQKTASSALRVFFR